MRHEVEVPIHPLTQLIHEANVRNQPKPLEWDFYKDMTTHQTYTVANAPSHAVSYSGANLMGLTTGIATNG